MRTAVVACGALAMHVSAIAGRRGWSVDVHPLPPELHNRPERIAPAVTQLVDGLRDRYDTLAVAYADCGSYGALDRALAGTGIERLRGEHCYDVFGRDEVAAAMAEQPGTYFLTDFLARTFERTVWRSLGLDRHPDLRGTYFHAYTRVIWLAQRRAPELLAAAEHAARLLGLPLEVRDVGESGLERELERLVNGVNAVPGNGPKAGGRHDRAATGREVQQPGGRAEAAVSRGPRSAGDGARHRFALPGTESHSELGQRA
jgi:hypothetical protein